MPDPATAAAESGTIWVTAASSAALVFGALGATVIGATIASKALDQVDAALAEDEAAGLADQQQQQELSGRRRRMTLEEAQQLQQQGQQQGKSD